MNLYLVTRTDQEELFGYDYVAGMIIAGENEEDIRYVFPNPYDPNNPPVYSWKLERWIDGKGRTNHQWAVPDMLNVRLIGVATEDIAKHAVLLVNYVPGDCD